MTQLSSDHDEVRIMTFNLEVDGGPDEGGQHPERWRVAHQELLAPRNLDLLFRQEATFSAADGNRRLHSAEQALGMRGFLSPTGQGRNPTAAFVRPGTFHVRQQFQQLQIWRTPPTNLILQLADAPGRDIVSVAWHGSFCSPAGRRLEADELSALADKVKQGKSFIGGGDTNEYPVPVDEIIPPINWSSPDITDQVHIQHRTTAAPDGSRVSCTAVDETLLRCGLHDPARYAARALSQPSALGPTAGHAAKGQGSGRRVDRIYLDPWLVQAVLAVEVVDTSGLSDHHAVEVRLSRRRMVEALHRQHAPMPPVALTA